MFGLGYLWLLALLITLEVCCDQNISECGDNDAFLSSPVKNFSSYFNKTGDENAKSAATSGKLCLRAPNKKKFPDGFLNYFDLVSGTSFEAKNVSDEDIIAHKCCSMDSYLNIDEFRCVQNREEVQYSNRSHIIINEIKQNNESGYLFSENFPNCGNQSVLSVQIVTKAIIESSGITLKSGNFFNKYCFDKNIKDTNQIVVLTCTDPSIFCQDHTCFRKCCPFGESYIFGQRGCRKSDNSFKPEFYNLETLKQENDISNLQTGIYTGDLCGCKGKYLLEKDELSYLSVQGSLYVPILEKCVATNDFCLEHIKGEEDFGRIGSFVCFPSSNDSFVNSPLQYLLLSLGFIISCTFLFITFLVYLFSRKSKNLYGKTLMCYIASLFSAYLCLAVVELKSKELDQSTCANMGYAILFSFLAAFFWLNVMSYDIWKTFRCDRSVGKSKPNKVRRRFLLYSLFAWSFPCFITGICGFINQMKNFPFESIKPIIGVENCWFSKKTKAIYVFFIAPISLIISCNIFFYVTTARKIWKVKSDIQSMEKKTKKFTANKDQFVLNGKLFVVMGITWSLEVISFFAPHPIWYLTDTANALHGVFIFAVFVLKRKLLREIWAKLSSKTNSKSMPSETTSKRNDDMKTTNTTKGS